MTDAPPSPELDAANVAKALAEAEAAKTQAERNRAEARHLKAMALDQELDNERTRYQNAKAAEDEAIRKASDLHHRHYSFTGEVSAASVAKCVAQLHQWDRLDPTCAIEIVFNSPGGSVMDGFALFDPIVAYSLRGGGRHKITTGYVGEAASMAGVLMQAGDVRWAGKQAWYLIHRAAFGAVGKTFAVEDQVEFVKRIEARIIGIFVDRSQLTAGTIKRNWERKDWWLDADQCLQHGLVDYIVGGVG